MSTPCNVSCNGNVPNQAEDIAGNAHRVLVFSPLESLTMELLQPILDQLDNVSLICLKNTSAGFRALVPPVEEKSLSRCQKWLIMCRFEDDMLDCPPMVACAFCKVKRPQKDFGRKCIGRMCWTAILKKSQEGMEFLKMMNVQPIAQYCYRHLTSCLGWPPAHQEANHVQWVHTLEPTCLHCGSKPASCGQSALKFWNGPETRSHCSQPCEFCPTLHLSTFSRHGPIKLRFITREEGFFWCFCGEFGGSLLWMKERHGKKEFLTP